MSIDLDSLHSKMVKIANSAVGSQLSKPVGATYKSHPNAPTPKNPRIAVDITGIVEEDGWETMSWINPETGKLEYITNKIIAFHYRCYGRNSLSITNDLHGYFRLPFVRDNLRATFKAGVVELTDILDSPLKIGDKNFIESSEFNILINVQDILIVPQEYSHLITNVSLDGELYRAKADPSPLTVSITV